MVTAETAVVLALDCAVHDGLDLDGGDGIAQVQLVDAARDGARALARGDDEQSPSAMPCGSHPEGLTSTFPADRSVVTVQVELDAEAPALAVGPASVSASPSAGVGTREDDLE